MTLWSGDLSVCDVWRVKVPVWGQGQVWLPLPVYLSWFTPFPIMHCSKSTLEHELVRFFCFLLLLHLVVRACNRGAIEVQSRCNRGAISLSTSRSVWSSWCFQQFTTFCSRPVADVLNIDTSSCVISVCVNFIIFRHSTHYVSLARYSNGQITTTYYYC